MDGAFEGQNAALASLSRLIYDELVKSILRIVEKLDLSVQKVATGEEVTFHSQALLQCNSCAFIKVIDWCTGLVHHLIGQVFFFFF